MSSEWLSAVHLAQIAGIDSRRARRALGRAAEGKPWRGASLEVRKVAGRGGKSGRCYEVAVRSLPEALQAVLRDEWCHVPALLPAPATARQIITDKRVGRLQFRLNAISEALDHPRCSTERGRAVAAASKRYNVPERTLNRWIAAQEREGGFAGLRHGSEGKCYVPRVAASRQFDSAFRAAGGTAEELDLVRAYVDLRCKAEWASKPGRAGWRNVAREVETSLRRTLHDVVGRPCALPRAAFSITRSRVDTPELRNLRAIDESKYDAKASDDSKPRITRDWTRLAPMDVVVVDVKPIDVPVMRPDGTVAYPRFVAFFDGGTQRVFGRLFLHSKGEGTRQEHIIETFLDMVADPAWGMPRQLYRDNGTEVATFDKIASALALLALPGTRPIINAKPYQGASKPIEGFFGSRLDRYVVSQMQGWTGGDRMKPKTQNVGRKPDFYPGSFEQFEQEFAVRVHDLMGRPMWGERNQWRGRSARQIFEEHCAAT